MLPEVHPYVWDSWPEGRPWSWLEKDLHKSLNLPSVYYLSQNKARQGSMSPQAAEQWGLRCSHHQLTQVCFATCARCRDGKSAAWLSCSCPPCSARRCPGGFVSIWGSKFCVWGTVCSVYYKIDLSVNDADLYRGSGCLERKPWGDILHRGDNTVIFVICMWYFWFRKGHFHCCLCPPDTLTPSFPGPGWQFCSNPNYCSLVCCPMKSSSIFASLCWS